MKRVVFAILLLPFGVAAQRATIKQVELAGEKVIVHYDLDDNNPNNEYLLNLYTSKDNFSTPLTRVTGDVGEEIKPGTNKKIEWTIREEYGGYKGKLSLELRGKVHVPFVRLQGFDTKKAYKRGKSFNLAWKPGNSNPVNIELYKGGERIGGDVNHPNSGSYSLFIPAHAKKGKDYRLKISDAKNSEEVIYTNNFAVVPKVPLLVKLVPFLVVGGAAAALSGGGKESATTTAGTIADPKFPGN